MTSASVPHPFQAAAHAASPLVWLPSGGWVGALPGDPTPLPAGQDWDAVRLAPEVAPAVYQHMCDATHGDPGPVLVDGHDYWQYWLVRPGATATWRLPGSVTCRSTGTFVTIVPAPRTTGPGPHWISPPCPEGRLAHAALLHSVIRAVVGPS